MKNALLAFCILFCFIANAQNYEEQWKTVTNLELDGRVKSAAEETDKIYALAKKDRNEPQIIKAFLYRAKYIMVLEEDAQTKVINDLRKEKKSLSIPSNALLESIYAQTLSDFLSRNSSKIYNRTHTGSTPSEDISTWTKTNFTDEIYKSLKRSLEHREILYKTPLERYEAVMELNPALRKTNRPLYDFLAQQYINMGFDYSPNSVLYDTKMLIRDTPEFLSYKINDSTESPFKDKIVFQQDLERFYIAKKDTNSLYRSVLRRLNFSLRKAYLFDETKLHIETLEKLNKTWKNSPYVYELKLTLAEMYRQNTSKTSNPEYLKKALDLCNEIIGNSRMAEVSAAALNIKNNIVSYNLNLSTEKTIVPNRPFLAAITFKNLKEAEISFYKISSTILDSIENNYALKVNHINSQKPVHSKTYTMPYKGENDFFEHSTEIILPGLDKGLYLAAIKPKMHHGEDEKYGFVILQASSIAAIEQEIHNGITYQVVDRTSGKPIKGAKLNIKGKAYKTDKTGKITFTYPKEKKDFYAFCDIAFEKDTLFTDINHHYYGYSDNNNKDDNDEFEAYAQLFIDRPIYRPGQTVYFKGILAKQVKGVSSVVPNVYVTVIAEDADYNEIKTFRLKTNEFGSFSGEFTLPKDIVTGEFRLTADEDEDYENDENYNTRREEHPFWDYANFDDEEIRFGVEEYKRPTFEISFNPVKENLRLNEKVVVTGFAKSFSGAPIANAKVEYSITHDFTILGTGYSGYPYGINHGRFTGEALTDADGNFKIEFTADAKKLIPEHIPLGSYDIELDIIDAAGERRSGNYTVYAGFHSLNLEALLPDIIKDGRDNLITFESKNINGQPLPVTGDIKIYRLKTGQEITMRRPWPAPEIQTIPEDEFLKNFPYFPYNDIALDKSSRETLVYSKTVNTGEAKSLKLTDFTEWKEGRYELIFTATDPLTNKPVETSRQFAFTPNDNYLDNNVLSYKIINTDYAKDGYAEIQLISKLTPLYINVLANYDGTYIYNKIATIKNSKETLKIPIPKNAMGRINLQLDYFWQNRYFEIPFQIFIKQPDKQLDFEIISINNKLVPGNKETWEFKIGNNLKNTAEVLASMYNMSLDELSEDPYDSEWHHKRLLFSYDDTYSRIDRKYALGTGNAHNEIYNDPESIKTFAHTDKIKLFGFDINDAEFIPAVSKEVTESDIQTLSEGVFMVSGTVADEAGPLPGASIIIKGTQRSAQSDMDGNFSIAAKNNEIIVISFVGYDIEEIHVSGTSAGYIMLNEDATNIQEVVTDKYRCTTAADVNTGAILQSLQGVVMGLNITTASGQPGADSTIILRGVSSINGNAEPLFVVDGIPVDEDGFRSINQSEIASFSILKDAAATSIYGNRGANGVIVVTTKQGLIKEKQELEKVQTRKNLNETAFFYPQLLTDKNGNIRFSFTSPEALTQWKLRLFAHSKDAKAGYFENISVTQKDLMISPNMPRFLREQDTIVIMAKINNMTTEAKAGNAMLQLYNASTMETIDALALNSDNMKSFTLDARGSTTVSWKIRIPEGMEGIQYKVLAKSGNFTDGEESIIPVLSNRMLVTESIPLWVRENTSKEYTIENLKNNTSSTLKSHKLVFEYTSNPAWIALQSLPYLMEYEYNCSEQIFSRFYANAIAAHIVNSNPKIKDVFEAWKKAGKPFSKLEQNGELKSLIASESPWMLDAKNEEENKNRMALLFELDKMKNSMADNLRQLDNRQSRGAFSWFEGGEDNEFITRHILAGLGHLQKMSIDLPDMGTVNGITKTGVVYIDKKFIEHDNKIKDIKKSTYKVSYNELHYLYARSFYTDLYPIADSLKTKIQPYLDYSKKNWLSYSLYQKAMAALVLNRFGEVAASKKILVSLKETATNNPEWGMYWKENKAGYYWFNSPIETQALLIEAFIEIDNDTQSADAMKVWLIKNKQNKSWPTTKSTTEAIYALLMKGTDWLSVKDSTSIKLGNDQELAKKIAESEKEAGTGYMKLVWNGNDVKKELATVSIHNKSAVPGYGGFYWQYFEDIDKIKPAEQGLIKIGKELFVKNNTGTGTEYKTVTNESSLKIGNVIMVRLTLEVKEDLEYVHLKDVRASAFEPIDVISSYERNGGLSYYKSTRDAATHFFFDKVNKGTYILEYEVKVNNAGSFSGGISTMQSMYAPEFSGNSGGGERIRINETQP